MSGTAAPLEVMQAAYAAFRAGDMATLGGLLAESTIWQIADVAPLDGEYHGRDAVFGFLGALMEQTGGTFSIEPIAMMAGESHASAFIRETAAREGHHLDATAVHVFEVANGEITRFYASSSDPANRSFWAPAS